jgi:hypothetical protein
LDVVLEEVLAAAVGLATLAGLGAAAAPVALALVEPRVFTPRRAAALAAGGLAVAAAALAAGYAGGLRWSPLGPQ